VNRLKIEAVKYSLHKILGVFQSLGADEANEFDAVDFLRLNGEVFESDFHWTFLSWMMLKTAPTIRAVKVSGPPTGQAA
jgi:hypothetical protein